MRIVDADAHPPIEEMTLEHLGAVSAGLFLNRLARAGVDVACGTMTLPEGAPGNDPDRLSEINRRAYELSVSSHGQYRMAVWVNPRCGSLSAELLVHYAAKGALMAGDIQPEWIEEDPAGLQVIMNAARDYDLPVNAHCKGVEQVEKLARRYPDVRLLIGGGSSGIAPLAAIDVMNRYANLYLLLSSAGMTANYVLHSLIERLPAQWLVFGTDYPFCNPAAKRAAAEWELRDTAPEIREAILSGSAIALTRRGENRLER